VEPLRQARLPIVEKSIQNTLAALPERDIFSLRRASRRTLLSEYGGSVVVAWLAVPPFVVPTDRQPAPFVQLDIEGGGWRACTVSPRAALRGRTPSAALRVAGESTHTSGWWTPRDRGEVTRSANYEVLDRAW
jgi:hypothetical protein